MIRIPPAPDASRHAAAPTGTELLGRLLGDLAPEEFLDRHYLRRPLARLGTALPWIHLADQATVDGLLRTPSCDVLVARQGGILPLERPASLAQEQRLAEAGCSCVFRHTERWHPGIARYAAAMAEVVPGAVDVHLYRTPAGCFGFGWHCDPEEVFIIQCAGSKRYLLRENTTHPAPLLDDMPGPDLLAAEATPLIACDLAPGDWLYIPGGWWHMAIARESSTSLSLGIRAWARVDLLGLLAGELAIAEDWRQRLHPPPGPDSPASTIAACQVALARLAAAAAGLADDPAAITAMLRRQAGRTATAVPAPTARGPVRAG
jgi:ribosomal protein L16 Arg81 hydroxylase